MDIMERHFAKPKTVIFVVEKSYACSERMLANTSLNAF